MKAKHLFKPFLLSAAALLFGMSSDAQQKPSNFYNGEGRSFRQAIQLKDGFKYKVPVVNKLHSQKPTQSKSKFVGMAMYQHDGAFFIPQDSMRFFWPEREDGSLFYKLFSTLFTENPLQYLEFDEKPQIDLNAAADSAFQFFWDDADNDYVASLKIISQYDDKNLITSQKEQRYNSGAWEDDARMNFSYDANENLVLAIRQEWNGTIWENKNGVKYAYDAKDNLIERINMRWSNASSAWDSTGKEIYEYDGQGNWVTEIYQFWSSAQNKWVNSSRRSMEYDGKNRVSQINMNWKTATSQWENSEKISYVYNSNGQLTRTTEFDWTSGAWKEDSRVSFTYDGSGNNTLIVKEDWVAGGWEYSDQRKNVYDGDNLVEIVFLLWDDMANKFVNDMRLSLDNNEHGQITKIKSDEWNGTDWEEVINDFAIHFYFEESSDETGIRETMQPFDFKLYPNPATESITLHFGEVKVDGVSVTDMSGKVVFAKQLKEGNHSITIPVSAYANGIYVIQAKDAAQQVATKSFVIRK